MSLKLIPACLLSASAVLMFGCGQAARDTKSQGSTPTAADASYLLDDEPTGAQQVKEARRKAQDNDEVTLVGRIGGEEKPWVEGTAAFTIVDTSLKPCNEKDDDSCETPWDYCCDLDELPKSKAMVKVVDAQGKTVGKDARELLGVKELAIVVVRGRAKRDEAGNLTVLADGVFVKK